MSPFKKNLQSVKSMNIQIFEEKKWPQILFVFVFVLFWEHEYIRIFFSDIRQFNFQLCSANLVFSFIGVHQAQILDCACSKHNCWSVWK